MADSDSQATLWEDMWRRINKRALIARGQPPVQIVTTAQQTKIPREEIIKVMSHGKRYSTMMMVQLLNPMYGVDYVSMEHRMRRLGKLGVVMTMKHRGRRWYWKKD